MSDCPRCGSPTPTVPTPYEGEVNVCTHPFHDRTPDPFIEANPWQPMDDKRELAMVGKLGEEVNECGAIIFRIIIQGMEEKHPVTGKLNRVALEEELADIQAAASFLYDHYGLRPMTSRVERKIRHLMSWHRKIKP